MPVITITSDWNSGDDYCGSLKARIMSELPSATIIDITHSVVPFSIAQAAYVVRNTHRHFAVGTVHLIAVNTLPDSTPRFLAVEYRKQFFISADNGIFSLLMDEEPAHIHEIAPADDPTVHCFPELSVFAGAAVHLASAKKLSDLGAPTTFKKTLLPLRPIPDDSMITGAVIYIDSYENAITNITAKLFRRVGKERSFEIMIQSIKYKISTISRTYSEVPEGDLVAIFNSAGWLEIAVNKGNAASLLAVSVNSVVRIKFFN